MMRSWMKAAILLVSSTLSAHELTEQEKLHDLRHFFATIEAGYGPKLFKEKMGIKNDELRIKYEELARQTQSNVDFYYLMAKLIAEYRDSHFNVVLPTDFVAKLGFEVDLVEDQVLIDSVDRDILSKAIFPFERGDQLLRIDGLPVEDVIENLSQYIGAGSELTQKRTAAFSLTQRRATRLPAPQGSTELLIKGRTGEKIVVLNWITSGTNFEDAIKPAARAKPLARLSDIELKVEWDELLPRSELSYRCSGKTRITIPKEATIVQQTPFVAYYHPTPKGNVGYLRIPHYTPSLDGGTPDEFFKRYEFAISKFEENTVGLVIDQDHNCGGSVLYLEKLVGLFMNENYQPMKFELLATKAEYLKFKSYLTGMPENTLEYGFQSAVANLIKKTWLGGEEWLTPKIGIFGNPHYTPNPVRYTKPIVMLIDELSGSGGDAFPSLLQGYGRAKLIGTRTMGAGGHVEVQGNLPFSAVGYRLTKSLFYRPDGVPVENNGAVPDFGYTPTKADFIGGYQNYQTFYLEKLAELIQ